MTEQRRDGTVGLSHAHLPTLALVGAPVVMTQVIGDPRHMTVTGQELWISDRAGDPYLHIIDLSTDSLVLSRGSTGEGPGDFGEVPQLSVRPGDQGAVWAYDARLRRLTRVTSDTAPDYRVIRAFGDQVNHTWSLQWQRPDRLIGVGDMDTNRIMVADSSGLLVDMVSNPLLGPDSVSLEARRAASSGYVMCVQPAEGAIALLYLAGGQIDLYHPDGSHRGLARVPFPSDGDWVLDRRGRVWFGKDWYHYTGCAGSRRFLYALFAGHRTDGPGGPMTRAATHVHVFDWQGELVRILAVDQELSAIAVSGDSVLFGAGQELGGVYRYRLPEAWPYPH